MKKGKFMLAALLGLYASTSFTMADPSLVGGYYQIGSYEDLVWFEQRVNSSTTTDQTNSKINAELTEDIIAPEGETWNSPIGKQSNRGGFQGTFNGKGHKIENLQFEPTASGDAGLFGVLKTNGHILNLSVINSTMGNASSPIGLGGGIAHTVDGTISNCCFIGNITSKNDETKQVGGICGINRGTIENCYTDGEFTGKDRIAGIAGETKGSIKNCYTNAKLSAIYIYPIAYKSTEEASIEKCYHSAQTEAADATKDDDFKSGMIAYTLNNGNDAPFKQNIGTDAFPSFDGKIVYRYQNCDKQYKYTNDESMKDKTLEHNWKKYAQKDPTCTTVGNLAYWTCSNEPDVFYMEGGIEKFANKEATLLVQHHEWTERPAIAPTCTEDGNVHYFSCKYEPGVYYKNNDGKEKLDEVIIPATGHDLEKHVMSANICTKEGESSEFIYYTCKNNKNEFFKEDGETVIENPEQAIYATTGHDWDVWEYKNTTDNVDTYIRTCKNNADHTETATVPHAWGEAELLSSEPAKDTYTHTCSSKYGEHSETFYKTFMTEEATYYSQLTGEIDTTLRANTEFKPVDTENDLLFAGEESTISGNNVVKGEECENLVIVDKVNFRTPNDFTANNLTFNRVNSLTHQTFILPFDVPTEKFNGKVYEFKEYIPAKRAMRFTYVEGTAKAGTPYILYRKTAKKANILAEVLKGIRLDASEWNNTYRSVGNNKCFYRGTYEYIQRPIDSAKESVFVFSNNLLCPAKGVAEVYGFRAYVELDNSTASPSLGLIFDDELTGVTTIDADGNLSVGNVDVYDMNGRLVRKNVESATCLQGLKPGVYVVNGEKFVKTANE